MKIGITADIHLKKTKKESPKRYKALENILDKLEEKDISTLIVAGDLFDKECSNYNGFDKLCKNNPKVSFLVIPGNHDSAISPSDFTADNLEIIDQPKIKKVEEVDVFFVPYDKNRKMGEIIADHEKDLPKEWLLVSHGDYLSGRVPENPYEMGTYMPINRSDLNRFKPNLVVLGHIHKRSSFENLHYVGSPSALHINETGPRYFGLINPKDLSFESQKIDSDQIYFNESLLTLPLEDEGEYIKERIEKMITSWNISAEELQKVTLRLEIRGYVKNLKLIKETIQKSLKQISFYENSPDFSKINILKGDEKLELVKKVKEAVEKKVDLIEKKDLDQSQILEIALKKVLN
jgi:DNA repair exonuclease SbcCD nuclease subunit